MPSARPRSRVVPSARPNRELAPSDTTTYLALISSTVPPSLLATMAPRTRPSSSTGVGQPVGARRSRGTRSHHQDVVGMIDWSAHGTTLRRPTAGAAPGGGADLTAFEGPWYKGAEVRRYGPRHQGGDPPMDNYLPI